MADDFEALRAKLDPAAAGPPPEEPPAPAPAKPAAAGGGGEKGSTLARFTSILSRLEVCAPPE